MDAIGKYAPLLDDTVCTLLSHKMLLALALDVTEDFKPLVVIEGFKLIGLCEEFSFIVDIGSVHVVAMGALLMQGIVHVDEAGG